MVSREEEQGVQGRSGPYGTREQHVSTEIHQGRGLSETIILNHIALKIGQTHGSPSDLITDGEFHGKLVSSKTLVVEKWMIRTGRQKESIAARNLLAWIG